MCVYIVNELCGSCQEEDSESDRWRARSKESDAFKESEMEKWEGEEQREEERGHDGCKEVHCKKVNIIILICEF